MTALLSKAKGRRKNQTPSGYTRILGNEELGNLISKLQSTVISAGSELEKLILEQCKTIDKIDDYLESDIYPEGIFVASKQQIKKSKIAQKSFEPDLIAFRRTDTEQSCYVIEVKDGDQFDTKKSVGERKHLHDYLNFIGQKIKFTVNPIICSFNATSKEQIVAGFKNKITKNEAYTGKELCNLLGIDFQKIVNSRKSHQQQNLNFFIERLLEIKEVREKLTHYL